jgi:DNA-binding PadR family transcriptional regulator
VSLRIAALGLLAQKPASGYDLLKQFEQSMANVWPATQSQLYGELNKLADTGLIEVVDIGPRGRKEYRITPAVSQCPATAGFPARRDSA